MRPFVRSAALAAALCIASACARDSEAGLRRLVDRWFFVAKPLYFKSQSRCTAAVYRLSANRPRPALPVRTTPAAAKAALRDNGLSAIRMEGFSPHDLTDELLLSGEGTFGTQALHAGALAGPCLEGSPAKALFFAALTQPGAILAYEAGNEGVMILDEAAYLLFYVAGDVW